MLAAQVQQNITDTIGVPWEAIIIDNTISPKGITQVYNKAAAQAKFDILCFVHEDVLFTTQNWGETLINTFKADNRVGLIGVAGSKYKSKLPSGWFSGISAIDCCNIAHLDKDNNQQVMYYL